MLKPVNVNLPDSSNVNSVVYYPASQKLIIDFSKGGMYLYTGVPEKVYTALILAPSVGSFLAKNIKGTFDAVKI